MNMLKVIVAVCLVLILIISGGAVEIPDYCLYKFMYTNHNYYPNILYGMISDLFAYIGLSFNIFRLFWSTLALGLMFYVVRQILDTKGQIYFLLFFIITQFCVETIQVRNFMVVGLFTFGFYSLFFKRRHSCLCYLILMLCGAYIHQVAYMFMPLIILPFFIKCKNTHYFGVLFIMFCVLCSFCHDFVYFIINFLPDSGTKIKLMTYLLHDRMKFGYILAFMLHFCLMGVILIYYKVILINHLNIHCKGIKLSYMLNMVLLANVYLMISWPLISIDMTCFRFIRVITPINHIVILLGFKYIYPFLRLEKKAIILSLLTMYILIYIYLCIVTASPDYNVWNAVFMGDNWILNKLYD